MDAKNVIVHVVTINRELHVRHKQIVVFNMIEFFR